MKKLKGVHIVIFAFFLSFITLFIFYGHTVSASSDISSPVWFTEDKKYLSSYEEVTVTLTDDTGIYVYNSTWTYDYGWSTSPTTFTGDWIEDFSVKTTNKISFTITAPYVSDDTPYYLWVYWVGKDTSGNTSTFSGKTPYYTDVNYNDHLVYCYDVLVSIPTFRVNDEQHTIKEKIFIGDKQAIIESNETLMVDSSNNNYEGTNITITGGYYTICTMDYYCTSMFVGLPSFLLNLETSVVVNNNDQFTYDTDILLSALNNNIYDNDVYINSNIQICHNSSYSDCDTFLTGVTYEEIYLEEDTSEIATTLTFGNYYLIINYSFIWDFGEGNSQGEYNMGNIYVSINILNNTYITVDDTIYINEENAIKISNKTAKVLVNDTSNAIITGYNRNNQYQTFSLSSGNELELTEGLWNIVVSSSDTTTSYTLIIFVPRLKVIYDNTIQYIDLYNSTNIFLPKGAEIILENITIGTTSYSMEFSPDGCIHNGDWETIHYTFADNTNDLELETDKNYFVSLIWGMGLIIDNMNDNGFFGIYEFEIEVFALEENLCDIVVNNGKITFSNFNSNTIQEIYSGGTVTYFIGKSSAYNDNLDIAFASYGVEMSFNDFFSSSIVSPQGLVGDVQLYIRIGKENYLSMYSRTETINLNSENENVTLNLHQNTSKTEEVKEKTLALSSSNIINHYNEIKSNYLLFVSMIFISAILAIEVIIIRKHQKAHN